MAYDNTDRGALFKNDKGTNPARPDHKGPLNANGEDGTLSAWWAKDDAGKLKKDKNGNPWLSLKWEPKASRDAKPAPEERLPASDVDMDAPF